jgi:hypothetical protein
MAGRQQTSEVHQSPVARRVLAGVTQLLLCLGKVASLQSRIGQFNV